MIRKHSLWLLTFFGLPVAGLAQQDDATVSTIVDVAPAVPPPNQPIGAAAIGKTEPQMDATGAMRPGPMANGK
jgi:hypothetical protein